MASIDTVRVYFLRCLSEIARHRDEPCGGYFSSHSRGASSLTGSYLLSLIPTAIAQSSQDLVRRGLSEGVVNYLPESHIQDTAIIKSILNDTLSVSVFLPSIE